MILMIYKIIYLYSLVGIINLPLYLYLKQYIYVYSTKKIRYYILYVMQYIFLHKYPIQT